MASRRTVSNNFLGTNLNKFRRDGTMCDVKLIAGGKTFHAHRLVLSAASVYYRTMFRVEMKEKNSGEVKLENITPKTLESCLEFIYTGQVHITDDNVHSLLGISSLQQIEELKSTCIDYIRDNISVQTCLQVLATAKILENEDLERKVLEFILKHLSEVCKIAEFYETIDKTMLAELLGMYSILHPGYKIVYQVVMSWVKFDENVREKFLSELLHHVGLENFPPQFLEREAEKNALLKGCEGCQLIVQEAMRRSKRQLSRTHETMHAAHIPEPEKTMIVIAETGSNSVLSFNPQSHKWKDYPKAPSQISHCVVVDNKIFVLSKTDRCMYFLKEGGESWERTSPCKFIEKVCAIATLGGKIYVGGQSKLVCYEPGNDNWVSKKAVSVPKTKYSLCGCKGCLYAIDWTVMACSPSETRSLKIWCEDSWSYGTRTPPYALLCSATVSEDKIYLLGETIDKMSVFTSIFHIYDTNMDLWSSVTGFGSVSRNVSSMCAMNKVFYVVHKDDTTYSVKHVDFRKKAILALPSRIAKWTGASLAAL